MSSTAWASDQIHLMISTWPHQFCSDWKSNIGTHSKKASDYFSDFARECHELEEEYLFWYIYLKAYIVINNVILTETQHIIY